MIQNHRFITRGIEAEVPLWLQNFMWYTIDAMEVESKDFLQVFTLSVENDKQKVVHAQEQPHYEKTYLQETDIPITAKVFVIDDGTHSTMLLAEEY